MSRMGSLLAAGLLWIATMVVLIATCVATGFDAGTLLVSLALMTMPTVGVLIVSRRPHNAIGWLYCTLGLMGALNYVSESFSKSSSPSAAELWFYWVQSWVWIPWLLGTFTFPFLLFPDGRLLSPRWKIVAWIAGAMIVQISVQGAFTEEFLSDSELRNPAYIDALGRIVSALEVPLTAATVIAFPVLIVAPVTSIALRLRRAQGTERQQIKWFAYVALLWLAGTFAIGSLSEIFAATIGTGTGWAADLIWGILPAIVIVGLPIATGVAVLRHRLYDIDLLIRRTLVYGLLSVSLVSTYLIIILVSQSVVRSVIGQQSDLTTAGATLGVAALFRPLHMRIRTLVDLRFYRRKYDAARMLESFSERLRDQLDLAMLSTEISAVVDETMQPEHVSLWLRPASSIARTSVAMSSMPSDHASRITHHTSRNARRNDPVTAA